MEKSILNIFKIVSYALIILGAVFTALIWYNGDSSLENNAGLQDKILTPFMWITIAALLLSFLLAILFPIFNMTQNPKSTIKSLMVLGVMFVIGIIAWLISSGTIQGDVLNKFAMEGDLTEAGAKRVSAALNATYILAGITVLTTIYSAVSSIFKR